MRATHLNITASARVLSIFLILILYSSSPYCQQKISGVVRSIDNLPLQSATIAVKDSNRATISDADGNFSILAKSGDVLIISSVGMVKKAIQVFNQSFIIITLAFDISSMEEVVVTGYGVTQRKDITGAVSKLTTDEFNIGIITNPLQQLQGKVAGLVIVQPGGDPNGDFTVRIRGATSLEGQPPLLVIDGVAIDDFNKSVTTLNPADIESYDILKDASAAAIYGSRGGNL